jgi:hypothetical protein
MGGEATIGPHLTSPFQGEEKVGRPELQSRRAVVSLRSLRSAGLPYNGRCFQTAHCHGSRRPTTYALATPRGILRSSVEKDLRGARRQARKRVDTVAVGLRD